jgi:tetratricopeptide (TPR) repeat protein
VHDWAAGSDAGHAVQGPSFYAESWALVHHLLAGDDGGRESLARYAGKLQQGADPTAAFVEEFGDLAALDRRIDQELRRAPREPLHVLVREPASYADLAAPSLQPADLEHRLGWLLAHHSPARTTEARSAFERALLRDPEHAGAATGLGWLAELAGDDDAALLLYGQARGLDPRDPLPPLLEGLSLLRAADERQRSGESRRSDEADGSNQRDADDRAEGSPTVQSLLESAREGFRRSLTLEPDLAEAWAGLGAAWVPDRAPDREGLEALHEAHRRLPGRTDVLYNLTVLEARLGSAERAAALYAELERRAEPELVESAREALLRVDLMRAERLLREGKTPEAVDIMGRVLRQTNDRDLATQLAARLEALERATTGGAR